MLPYVQQFVKIKSMDEFKKAGNKLDYSLTPLTKIHLYSNLQYELAPNGNIQLCIFFPLLLLFILADSLHQFHESYNSAFCKSCTRSWHKKSSRNRTERTNCTISQRINADGIFIINHCNWYCMACVTGV